MPRILPTWIEEALGVESSMGEGTVWSLDSSWTWAPWITLLFLAFAVAWVVFFYAREQATAGRRTKALLVALRLALIGLLLFMLAGFMISLERTGLPYVVVIVDDSASMAITDRYQDTELSADLEKRLKDAKLDGGLTRINLAKLLLLENNAAVLRGIEADYKLKVYFLAEAARAQLGDAEKLTEELRELAAAGETTRLGAGLRSVLADLRGTPPAAIVILTDGVTTDGETLSEAAGYASRKNVPLITVGLGNEEPVRDIQLSDLLVDDVVFLDDVVNFQATLTSSGFEGREAELVLREMNDAQVLAKTTVALGGDGRPTKVHLPYRPKKVGKFEYVVEVTPFEDESQADNNREQKLVEVRKETIRVLYVQAYPNFEFRYLKNMLERDTTVELNTVLQEADREYAQLDRSAIGVFPVRRDDLFKYDVLIFGDVNPAFLSASVMGNIRDFVELQGGGLVFISGPLYTPLKYRDSPLAALFPIDLNTAQAPGPEASVSDAYVVRPTELGMSSPHMQLGDTLAESSQIWRQLPPLYWLLEAPHTKPAARVLAVHPTRLAADGRPLPLFAMQYVGAGKVLFHASDETWRWRFRTGDALFARYWVQSIRMLARSKLLGGDRTAELTLDRGKNYRRGDPVRIRVRFFDERRAPAVDDGVSVVLEQEGGKTRRIKLSRHAASRAVFEGVFAGATEGKYHVWMVAPTVEGRAPAADFRVHPPQGERERVQMDAAELARAAQRTGGKFYKIETCGRLLAELPEGRQIPVETLPPEVLWNRWWVLLVFLTLLVSEWVLRKRVGLL